MTTDWKRMTADESAEALARWVSLGGDAAKFARGALPLLHEYVAPEHVLLPCDRTFPLRVADALEVVGPWFLRGELPAPTTPRVAVVGTREPAPEGVRVCTKIVRELAAAGVAIISGGAIGIDTIAHETALACGAPTVAILPSGFDHLTPARNRALFARIADGGGALVSEYPLGVRVRRYHFRRRNELIATYADALLVVRSRSTGGTMISAAAARRYGTPLFAIPGSPEDATAEGCNALIHTGAAAITSASQLLEALGLDAPHTKPASLTSQPLVTPAAQQILDLLTTPRTVDQLCNGRTAATVLAALTELEVLGCVELVDGRWRAT